MSLDNTGGFKNRIVATTTSPNLNKAIDAQQKTMDLNSQFVAKDYRITRDDLPEHLKSIWDDLLMPVNTDIALDDVILSPENQQKIQSFIKEIMYRDKLIEYGLEPANRILMYGASGTGKTFLSKALSNHLGYTMLYVDIAKALTDDSVAKNISDVFTLANHIKHCIIFFDECDAIAWNRDSNNADTGTIRRATNSIFQYLDQMDPTNIFISCTNMLQRLDAAFERRFTLKMEFRRPSLDLDECIKHFLYKKFKLDDDVNNDKRGIVKRRAKENVKLSYYEIEEIVKKAMKRSILNDTNVVKTSDIYNDFALAMNIKIAFGTEDDSESIFHNRNTYDPSHN